MARIKVTGFIETDDLPASFVDTNAKEGLSAAGFDAVLGYEHVEGLEHEGNLHLSNLDDIEFEYEG